MRFRPLISLSIVLFAGAALADSPHFTSSSGTLGNDGALTIAFKEAGLGANLNINFIASADAAASWGCINKGGNNPQATNKRAVSGPVSAYAVFASGKNGAISQSLSLKPPAAPADFTCPSGQNMVLADIAYTNVVLKDATTPVTANVTGSFTKTFYTFK